MTARNVCVTALLTATFAISLAMAHTAACAADPLPLAAARSWVYRLQGDVARIARSNADVAVVDWDHVRTHALLEALKRKPDKARRVVLGYLSIGEAEDSRAYWQACCGDGRRPSWLTDRSDGWPGNYAVRFWDMEWQRIVKTRLSQIIAAGFDGVYFDRADVWETMRPERGSARADMVSFVRELSAMARAAKPSFSIVVQNAEELLSDKDYLAAIDGIAKEDLFHGVNHDALRNPAEMIAHSMRLLQLARAGGKPVFVVEYLPEGQVVDAVRAEITGHGFIPLFATRDLNDDARPERASAANTRAASTALPTPKFAPIGQAPTAPAAPEIWSESEIATARQTCSHLLAGLDVKIEPAPALRIGGCGAAAPIRLLRVAGVEVRPSALISCPMAAALHTWMQDVVQPAARELLGSPLIRMSNVASYHCRNVIGGRSGSLSQHAFANAVDVADFTTATGRTVRVQEHWGVTRRDRAAADVRAREVAAKASAEAAASPTNRRPEDKQAPAKSVAARRAEGASRLGAAPADAPRPAQDGTQIITSETSFLKRAHAGACGIFGTVLGPEANADHRDHFHVDLADRRRTGLCE